MVDKLGRPDWHDYFMAQAHLVSSRSLDPHTKHGCVAVLDNSILTTGYNSPPRGCQDEEVTLTRPEKYTVFSHAEANTIANAARHGIALRGSTFYITGFPCEVCFRSMINAGVKKIIFGHIGSSCVDEKTMKAIDFMLKGNDILFLEYKETEGIEEIFAQTLKRMQEKKNAKS